MTSPYVQKLASTANSEHSTYHLLNENSPPLSARIQTYWEDLGFEFPGVATAWSAVFVSWCVKTAGAGSDEFRFSSMHSEFVNQAIANQINDEGVFRGRRIEDYSPSVGDILQINRNENEFDYDHAADNKFYVSHSAIIVEVGEDSDGGYIKQIGGNESDSIRKTLIRLNEDGLIDQPDVNPYICTIQTLK
jgi:hypothetical protein